MAPRYAQNSGKCLVYTRYVLWMNCHTAACRYNNTTTASVVF